MEYIPLSYEKEWGKFILIQLLELFPNIKIYTIGRHAQKALKEMQIKTEGHMTHPRLAKNSGRILQNSFYKYLLKNQR